MYKFRLRYLVCTLFCLVQFLVYIVPQAQAQSTAFRFIAWGDTKSSLSVLTSLSTKAKQLNPKFTIYSGDLESSGFTQTGIDAWKQALNGGTNNGIFDITFPVRGNHDSGNTAGWQGYFDSRGMVTRVGGSSYNALDDDLTYSFDVGNSHFIGIDVLGDANKLSASQVSWVDADLAAAESRGLVHAFIFFHGPIYCVDGHCTYTTRTGTTDAVVLSLIKVFEKHPIVSATFHGHEHTNAYIHVDNTRIPEMSAGKSFEEFVAGSAGAGPDSCKANRTEYCMAKNGFMAIDINGSAFTVSFYSDTGADRVFQFSKSGTPQPTLPGGQPTATPVALPTNIASPTSGAGTGSPVPTVPGVSTTPSSSPLCPLKNQGDADCNGSVELADYVCWIYDFIQIAKPSGSLCVNSDFDGANGVTILDYVNLLLHLPK